MKEWSHRVDPNANETEKTLYEFQNNGNIQNHIIQKKKREASKQI